MAARVADVGAYLRRRIEEEMWEQRLSGRELGRRAGISEKAISAILCNTGLSPRLDTVAAIAQGLGVSLVSLVDGGESAAG